MSAFTRQVPAEPGWYWWRINANRRELPVEVFEEEDSLMVSTGARIFPVSLCGGEFGPRIPSAEWLMANQPKETT